MKVRGVRVIVALVLVLALGSSVKGIDLLELDGCYGVGNSVSRALVGSVVADNRISIYSPESGDDLNNVVSALYTDMIQTTASPFSFDVGICYPNSDFIILQSCFPLSSSCAYANTDTFIVYVVSNEIFNNSNLYVFALNVADPNYPASINLNNTFSPGGSVAASAFDCTKRSWYNSTGQWSTAYPFYNLPAQSRTFVGLLPNSTVRVLSDRNPDEPCNTCYARSPCPGLANYIAASAPFDSWINAQSMTQVNAILAYMVTNYMNTWQVQNTINSIAIGLNNGNLFIATDCAATPIANIITECGNAAYLVEVRHPVFGDNRLHAFGANSDGTIATTGRTELTSYNLTSQEWWVRGEGWSDNYQYTNVGIPNAPQVIGRGYVRWFYGGVLVANINPNKVCPGSTLL